jgi:hypothetical protein
MVIVAPHPKPWRFQLHSSEAGISLLENMFACATITLFLSGVFTLNGTCLSLLRQAKDHASASQVLQQRVEQLRIANWQRITDPTWLRDNVLNQDADGSSYLKNAAESLLVEPYGSSSINKNQFNRRNGAASSGMGNTSLIGETAVKVTWTVTWSGLPAGVTHMRQEVAILGLGGVAK